MSRSNLALRALPRPGGFAGWRWELVGQIQGRVLKIGCGTGYNFEHYPARAAVTAFEPDAERLRTAAARRAPIRLARADAEQMAWPAQSFDSVVGTLVFCSIPTRPRR